MNIFSDIKAIIGALAGAALMFALFGVANTIWLLPKARTEGRERYIAEQAVADQKSELERKGDDAKIQRMSDYDLCVAHVGRVPACDSLKLQPLPEKQPVSGRDRRPDQG